MLECLSVVVAGAVGPLREEEPEPDDHRAVTAGTREHAGAPLASHDDLVGHRHLQVAERRAQYLVTDMLADGIQREPADRGIDRVRPEGAAQVDYPVGVDHPPELYRERLVLLRRVNVALLADVAAEFPAGGRRRVSRVRAGHGGSAC